MDTEQLLIFDLVGTFAHFKKYDTNSSSLSYTFPPRTTITGIIAAMLGIERDRYYDIFSTEKCRIALSVLTPLRKQIHTINYLFVISSNDFNGSNGHTQIPVEIVFPVKDEIRYRVYFSHKDKALQKSVEEHIEKPVYPLYFGISEFIAKVEPVGYGAIEKVHSDDSVSLNSVVNLNYVKDRGLVIGSKNVPMRYISEIMPIEFDSERKLKSVAKFVYEQTHKPIIAYLKTDFYRVEYGGKEENILFMG
jgi:CRISPR-associated protein Cas5h